MPFSTFTSSRYRRRGALVALQMVVALCGLAGFAAVADAAGSSVAAVRITEVVDESKLVAVGTTARFATAKNDKGAVSDGLPMEHIFLQLQRAPEQEEALTKLIQEQQDPRSSNYHKWLTADELGERFGPAQADIATVTQWLASHGLRVNQVHSSGLTIDVSGTAGQVRDAFHTEIHQYAVKDTQHISNASDPKIPAALTAVVSGMTPLNDVKPRPLFVKRAFTFKCKGCPTGFTNTQWYDEGPADFAVIYNVAPLYKAKHPITGKGVTVTLLEDTDVQDADVATFRKAAGLSSYSGTFSQIHPGPGCSDPGTNGAEGEAALDSEWGGAIAPDATVHLASCADTAVQFGAFIAAINLLDEKSPAPIMSLSYLECEADNGPGPNGNGFVYSMWQQAASEGVSVFVAAGDGAAAGCDDFDTATYAAGGIAANGLASTPYNTATGGTDFLDTFLGENSTYWSNSNGPGGKSALSYVPEIPWDDSCASNVLYIYWGYTSGVSFCNSTDGASFLNIVGGSGAPSDIYAKPYWQKGVAGNPNDGARDLPDVSLLAANGIWEHAILLCMSDPSEGGAPCDYSNPTDALFNSGGGTSFTAPQYASIQALINQKAGGPQGNAAPIYYDLAKSQGVQASCNATNGNKVGSACIFHDVTAGNNDVPCYGPVNCYNPTAGQGYGVLSVSDTQLQVAYPSQKGWDFTTGLGSVNVTNLVNAWP